MTFFARLCRDHAKLVVVICLLVTIPVAVGISFLEVKAGQKDLIPSKYEASRTIKQVDELFGGITTEKPMVESDAMLTYPMIKKFLLLEGEMADTLGEDSYAYVEHFLTGFGLNVLSEARAAAQSEYGLSEEEAALLLPDMPTLLQFGETTLGDAFGQQIEDGVAEYLANPVAYKWTVEKPGSAFLSRDGRYATVLIMVNPEFNSSQSKAFATKVEDFFNSYFEEGEPAASVYISGDPSIDKDLEEYVISSTWLLAVLAMFMLMALLYITFQRFSDVLLPLVVIILSAIWIYGLMGWIGYPYTVISVIIGPLVLGISLGNLVYMMGRFYEEFGIKQQQRQAAYKAVTTVGVAIFLACITTAFGFASFLLSDFDILRELGIMAAAGIAVCFLLSVTFLPALMIMREDRRLRRGKAGAPRGVAIFSPGSDSRTDRFLGRIADISQNRPGAVVVIYAFIILICIMGAFQLTTTPDLRALAPQDIPSLKAQYLEEDIFGGQQQDVILLTGDIMRPEALAAMESFQADLAQSEYFEENGSSSIGELIHDFRVEMGLASPQGDFAAGLPATQAEAEEDLAAIGELFGPQEGKLVSDDHQAALISVFSEGAKSNTEMMEKNRVLQETAAANFEPVGIGFQVGGITPMTAEMLGNLVPTQIWTAILALCLSGLVLVLIFRSLTFGLATLSVLIAGIAVEMGFLALMGWTLDMMTVLIASMIIGMGIDYGIHVTHRFLEEYDPQRTSLREALVVSVTRVGKPLLASVVSTAGAFMVISFSRMAPIRRFGVITALSLVVSLAASLLVLPSIITLIARRRLRSVEESSAEGVDLKPVEADT